jgi:hypothetical protein
VTTTTELVTKTACYQLVYDNGEPVDTGDGTPCYSTEEEAAEQAARFRVDGFGTPTPKQLPAPCVSISCSECGYVIDEDDAQTYHFWPDEVEDALKAWEWTVNGDRKLCPECAKGAN